MARERVKPDVGGAGPRDVTTRTVEPGSLHAKLDDLLHKAAVGYARSIAPTLLCRPRDVKICAEADRDIRSCCVEILVSVNAPTLKTPLAGKIRVTDSALESQDPHAVAEMITFDVFAALQRKLSTDLESLLTDEAKAARDARKLEEPIPGMFDAMDRMAAWESRNAGASRTVDPVALRRARALEAVAAGGQARATVGDVDAALAASREGLVSADEALERINRGRRGGLKNPARELAGMAEDRIDALVYALGGLAPAMRKTGDAMRNLDQALRDSAFKNKIPLPVKVDKRVPKDKVRAVLDGKVLGEIVGIGTAEPEKLAIRCAECGGRAILSHGVFGMAGARYRCGSCGVVLEDCEQCRALYARREDQSCPRCSGRERRKAKA